MSDLSELQKKVLKEAYTERPGTGALLYNKDSGKYVCADCGSILFNSDQKYESRCGWPSFNNVIEEAVELKDDFSFGMVRTEVVCKKCGGHLGHYFKHAPGEP